MNNKKAMLIIMDGWGIGQVPEADAIKNANVPFTNSLYNKYPNTTLTTFGRAVGLPDGQMGNSEVGHLNLGAGRIVYQELERINVNIENGEFFNQPVILDAIHYAKSNNKKLHLIGLVSDGGVHSHINHLKALTTICQQQNFSNVKIHAFTDGRDCDPKSGFGFIQELENHLKENVGSIATIVGRYYAMDRDHRWERIKIAYDAMVNGIGTKSKDLLSSIEKSYAENITDEFLLPIINENISDGKIEDGDAVICFNFRTDRCREITEVLTQTNYPDFGMHILRLYFVTMTRYEETFKNIHVVFEKNNLTNTIGEVVSNAGKTQVRIAETEKYPHVSFFFSGGREEPFSGEKRIMIPSPKVATYDLQPEMSAPIVCDAIVAEINANQPDFICLNFANADMVGHTGVFKAVVKAVETVDSCVEKVITTALKYDYVIFLTADHGNSDFMINADGTPNTAHTKNPVPLFVIDNQWKGKLKPGKLADLAPSILHFMGINIPVEMTGDLIIE